MNGLHRNGRNSKLTHNKNHRKRVFLRTVKIMINNTKSIIVGTYLPTPTVRRCT